MEEFQRILVVSRLTASCRIAVERGVYLARKHGARLYVMLLSPGPFDLDSLHLPERFLPEEYGKYESGQAMAAKVVDEIISQEVDSGLLAKKLIRHGNPVDEVEKAVAQEKIDLIVMLAHREGFIEHLLFGGDTDAVVRAMPCSILLVKGKDRETDSLRA